MRFVVLRYGDGPAGTADAPPLLDDPTRDTAGAPGRAAWPTGHGSTRPHGAVDAPGWTDAPATSDTPGTPDGPATPDTPRTSDAPATPDAPGTSDAPVAAAARRGPHAPDAPGAPDAPRRPGALADDDAAVAAALAALLDPPRTLRDDLAALAAVLGVTTVLDETLGTPDAATTVRSAAQGLTLTDGTSSPAGTLVGLHVLDAPDLDALVDVLTLLPAGTFEVHPVVAA